MSGNHADQAAQTGFSPADPWLSEAFEYDSSTNIDRKVSGHVSVTSLYFPGTVPSVFFTILKKLISRELKKN